MQKLTEKHPGKAKTIKRIVHIVCCCFSYVITALILLLIERVFEINLITYGVG